jgi:hypothetical protein
MQTGCQQQQRGHHQESSRLHGNSFKPVAITAAT